jgi:hypothetical protein
MPNNRPWYKLLENTVGGSVDMNVDGSSTPQVFEQAIDTENQRIWIHEARCVVHSTAMDLSGAEVCGFGAASAAALSSGITLQFRSHETLVNIFQEAWVQMGDIYRYSHQDDAVNLVDGVAAGTDSLVFVVRLAQPILLEYSAARTDTPDRIIATVRDDLTSLTKLQIQVSGEEYV